jgi:hypothetical protein
MLDLSVEALARLDRQPVDGADRAAELPPLRGRVGSAGEKQQADRGNAKTAAQPPRNQRPFSASNPCIGVSYVIRASEAP